MPLKDLVRAKKRPSFLSFHGCLMMFAAAALVCVSVVQQAIVTISSVRIVVVTRSLYPW